MLTKEPSRVAEFMRRVETALNETEVDRDRVIALLEEAVRLKMEIRKQKQDPKAPCI